MPQIRNVKFQSFFIEIITESIFLWLQLPVYILTFSPRSWVYAKNKMD
jgi:hypothetical protein